MKALIIKILCTYFVVLLVFSCKDENPSENKIKPIRVVNRYSYSDTIEYVDFKYDENRIIEEKYNKSYIKSYVYSNKNLIKINETDAERPEMISYYLIEYNSKNQISAAKHYSNTCNELVMDNKYEYEYRDNIPVKFIYTETTTGYSYYRLMKYDTEGNIIEIRDYETDTIGTKKILSGYFEYDQMNDPWSEIYFPNIPGMFPRLHNTTMQVIYSFSYHLDNQNNYQVVDSLLFFDFIYQIQYNSMGFPTTVVSNKGDSTFYEYQ